MDVIIISIISVVAFSLFFASCQSKVLPASSLSSTSSLSTGLESSSPSQVSLPQERNSNDRSSSQKDSIEKSNQSSANSVPTILDQAISQPDTTSKPSELSASSTLNDKESISRRYQAAVAAFSAQYGIGDYDLWQTNIFEICNDVANSLGDNEDFAGSAHIYQEFSLEEGESYFFCCRI